jgi:hypothetical protein
MKVMMFGKATKQTEASQPPTDEALLAMHKFNEELEKAGVLLDLGDLTPTSRGVRAQYCGSKRTVTDGRFPESKELSAGYLLLEARSRELSALRAPRDEPGADAIWVGASPQCVRVTPSIRCRDRGDRGSTTSDTQQYATSVDVLSCALLLAGLRPLFHTRLASAVPACPRRRSKERAHEAHPDLDHHPAGEPAGRVRPRQLYHARGELRSGSAGGGRGDAARPANVFEHLQRVGRQSGVLYVAQRQLRRGP